MAYRGRGRGLGTARRGNVAVPTKPAHRIPKSIDDLAGYLHTLNKSNIQEHGAEFADMVLTFATDDEKTEDTVNFIFDATVSDRQNSELGGQVCRLIIQGGSSGDATQGMACSMFRKKLLKRFQEEFKQMRLTRKNSIEHWLGIFSFLCEVYIRIKAGDRPIEIIGKAILKNVQTMLQDGDIIDDEIECICSKLKVCGKVLEEDSPDLFANAFTALRKQVIKKNSSCLRKCYILELIEFKYLRWSDPTKCLDRFYSDAIADAAVEDESSEY